MKKHLFFAVLFAGLFGYFSLNPYGTALWILFLLMSGYHVYRLFKPVADPVTQQEQMTTEPSTYGVLGEHVAEATDPDDKSYGLYIRLNEAPVLVDIREDEHLEARKAMALRLFRNQEALNKDFHRFLEENPEFRPRRIAIIGLHARDLDQGEVFWEPDGYTLLRSSKFVLG